MAAFLGVPRHAASGAGPGAPVRSRDPFASKIGGAPWLEACSVLFAQDGNAPGDHQPEAARGGEAGRGGDLQVTPGSCSACSATLVFFAQVYAPVAEDLARILAVFLCNTKACTKPDVVVLRVQNCGASLKLQPEGERPSASSASLLDSTTSLLKEINETSKETPISENTVEDLEADFEAMMLQAQKANSAKGKKKSKKKKDTKQKKTFAWGEESSLEASSLDDLESLLQKRDDSRAAAQEARALADADVNPDTTKKTSQAKQGARNAKSTKSGCAVNAEDEDEDEEDETEEVVLREAFDDYIAAAPAQCLRYAYGGDALLPRKVTDLSKIPVCENCGEARVFEMQFLPASLWEWRHSVAEVEIDFATILIFVCPASCGGSKASEFALLIAA
ncbi:Programmed cell death protein 2-like [Hondaea fermentalgiana]|uniref:Programmed cell death protein 2-like n=1 Tax=Hondaea fermentalgiana TaxID=2315210 RepID=A0A2R5GIM9_9STRA|nr:Programmed cell death protein 2-like [Hondaea fermentalgiana]|eukprot:GBG30747.1 Programmed cell death protein 2-like [Hondaea fermentalgiana]